MYIEIYGAKFVNKGAELMLLSIINKVKERYPNAEIVLPCSSLGEWRELDRKGFKKKLTYRKSKFLIPDLGIFIPKFLRKKLGVVVDNEIKVIFEASGFAYGDQWTYRMAMFFGQLSRRWKKQQRKIIFMPQAFGPFNKGLNRKFTTEALDLSNLVFVRDRVSLAEVKKLNLKNVKPIQKPDFTILLKGKLKEEYERLRGSVCLIPNNKIIETSSNANMKNEYIDFFTKTINYLRDRKLNCFILNHEGQKDYQLAELIQEKNPGIEIVWEKDPLAIKGIISISRIVIGSRFHGLVSALSQGIPSLAIGWSHKYEMLFEDFGFKEGMVYLNNEIELFDKLSFLTDEKKYSDIKDGITSNGLKLKKEAEAMWEEIFLLTDKI